MYAVPTVLLPLYQETALLTTVVFCVAVNLLSVQTLARAAPACRIFSHGSCGQTVQFSDAAVLQNKLQFICPHVRQSTMLSHGS